MLTELFLEAGACLVALLALTSALFYFYLRQCYRHWAERGVPGPQPRLFFGNLAKIFTLQATEAELLDEFYHEFHKERYFGIYNLWKPTLVLRDPELVKRVTETDFWNFSDHPQATHLQGSDTVFNSIFFMKGEKWKGRRQFLTKIFSPRKLKEYMVDFKRGLGGLLTQVGEHSTGVKDVDITQLLNSSSAKFISAAFYGLDLSTDESLTRQLVELSSVFSDPPKSTVLKFLAYPVVPGLFTRLKLPVLPARLYQFYGRLTRQLLQARRTSPVERSDLVSLLVTAVDQGVYDDPTQKMCLDEATGHVYVMFLGAHHTTQMTICHALNLLAHHPDQQELVIREIVEVLAGREEVTYEDLPKFTRLQAVIAETLRMYPLVGVLKRTCTSTYRLSEELTLPAGSEVYIPAHSLHHDPDLFPEPESFKPERFIQELGGEPASKSIAYMPFGRGPRQCIGFRFAEVMMTLLLSSLLLKFKVLPSPKMAGQMKMDPKMMFITVSPIGGVWVRFQKRNNDM